MAHEQVYEPGLFWHTPPGWAHLWVPSVHSSTSEMNQDNKDEKGNVPCKNHTMHEKAKKNDGDHPVNNLDLCSIVLPFCLGLWGKESAFQRQHPPEQRYLSTVEGCVYYWNFSALWRKSLTFRKSRSVQSLLVHILWSWVRFPAKSPIFSSFDSHCLTVFSDFSSFSSQGVFGANLTKHDKKAP